MRGMSPSRRDGRDQLSRQRLRRRDPARHERRGCRPHSRHHRSRLFQIGLLGGSTTTIDLGRVMRRRLTITGSTLRIRTVEEKGALARELETNIWPLLSAKRVAPVIDRTFPLAEASAAHQRMESGAHIGKLVLTVPRE